MIMVNIECHLYLHLMIVYNIYFLILLEGYMRNYFKRNIFIDPFKNLFVIIIINNRLLYLDLLK